MDTGATSNGRMVDAARTFGDELRRRRSQAGLTQRELAERVRYSRETVAAVECGRRYATRSLPLVRRGDLALRRLVCANGQGPAPPARGRVVADVMGAPSVGFRAGSRPTACPAPERLADRGAAAGHHPGPAGRRARLRRPGAGGHDRAGAAGRPAPWPGHPG